MSTATPQESKMRQLRLAPFALALICFLLPFIEISCQGQKMATLTGMQLAMGTSIEQRDAFTGQIKSQETPKEILVLVALICTVVAAGYCFVPGGRGRKVSAIAGALGLLLLLMAKSKINDDALREGHGLLTIGYGIGYTFTCVLLIAGAVISVWQMSQAGAAPAVSQSPPPPSPPPPSTT